MKRIDTTVHIIPEEADREAAIVQNMDLVHHIARRLKQRLPPCVTFDDLSSAGTIGLMQAVDRFDASRGASFKTYAQHRIRGAMLDYLRDEDPFSRETRRRIRQSDGAIAAPVTIGLNQLPESTLNRLARSPERPASELTANATAQVARRCLSARENRLITLLFDFGWLSSEVAAEFKVNESRVSQIKRTALAKLRRAVEAGAPARAA
jgi:RNA polymerase sigma factor for flagellar operon FliA